VRVSLGTRILYQSGDMHDPFVSMSKVPLPSNQRWFNAFHRETAASGQRVVLYTVPFHAPNGSVIFVETGASVEPMRHVLRSLLLIMLLATPIILVVATGGGYLLMSQPLKPVVVLTERAERVGERNLRAASRYSTETS
jgi:hypothetical protein